MATAKENNFVVPSVFQGHYSAVGRKVETDLFPTIRKHGMTFYAYSPQAGGFLAKTRKQLLGNELKGERWDPRGEHGRVFHALYSHPTLLEALDVWDRICTDSGIPRAELAYRWVAHHSLLDNSYRDGLVFSGSSEEQVRQTIAGLNRGPLPDEIAQRINNVWELVKEEAPLDHFNR